MGILDEAIREHLELKRQHGAEETELKDLEKEAFGPAERPQGNEPATRAFPQGESSPSAEQAEAAARAQAEAQAPPSESAQADDRTQVLESNPFVTESVDFGPPPEPVQERRLPQPEPTPEQAAAQTAPPAPADEESGDASDALERERTSLIDQPTEHFDVEEALAQEEVARIRAAQAAEAERPEPEPELEKVLGDEQAVAEASPEAIEQAPESKAVDQPVEPVETAAPDEPEPGPAAPEAVETEVEERTAEADRAEEPPSEELRFDEGSLEDELDRALESPGGESSVTAPTAEPDVDAPSQEYPREGAFFDQEEGEGEGEGEDLLEDTPDFLEDTPEHDKLWFEQKPPKDFEFGD